MRGETNELRFGGENEILREKGKTPPFLLKLEEPGDNSLRIRIAAPRDGEAGTGIDPAADSWNVPGLREMLEKSCPVYADASRCWEIVFPQYLMVQVRNESYTVWDDYEIRRGRALILFERSRLLDSLQTVTICRKMNDGEWYPGEWKHYGIYTEDQIIDVIAHTEPQIRRIVPDTDI
ncbi:MAG: hypothetical protein IJD06_02580 [Clostridia bacterium]|nr:hypothetical protein [Clostridia bacterium]